MRKLHESENHISITAWLNENLEDKKSIKGCCQEVKKVPKTKGIYFWFMKSDGYKVLSKYITINPIEPRYTKKIDGVQYDLVYLGTAGTGKKGNSNLAERFEWHINQAHTVSNVCHGTLSTLRAGLGSLLADDLIIPDTENLVNSFMKNYMKVFWIEYTDDKLLIDNDEKILIKVLRPLLNIKNNPNAKANAPANSPKLYKIRRAVVYKSTRLRIGCKGESGKIREKNNPNEDTPIYNHQIVNDNNEDCLEYFVLQHQHIGEVTRGIEGLPLGKSKITIYDSNNPKIEFTEWTKVTGNNNDYNAQNIYKYFDNTSSSGLRRFIVIQNWMKANDIEEITVKVCPVGNDGGDNIIINKDNNKTKPKPIKTISKLDVVDEENIDNTNSKNVIKGKFYLIPCSNKKIKKEQLEQKEFIMENLEFNNELGKYRIEIIGNLKKSEKINNHIRKVNNQKIIIRNDFNFKNTTQANKVYSKGRLFNAAQSINWKVNDIKKVYIISALFGIIRADNYIPLYDFAMTDEIDGKKDYAKKYWKKKLDGIIKKLVVDGNVVFNLLSNEYLDCIDKKVIDILKIQTVLGNSEIDIKKNDRNSQSIKRGKWLKYDLNI